MYTRCPSCRAEISFEPPANASSLPDGYKHKIKCPSCGVTIGVKIPKVTSDIQPTFTPQNPNAVPSEPVAIVPVQEPVAQQTESAVPTEKRKVYGRVRNSVLIVLSALVAIICALGYLVNPETNGALEFTDSKGLAIFDGITPLINLVNGDLAGSTLEIIVQLLPTFTFVLAILNLIVAITTISVGVYSKLFNLISGLLIAAASVSTIFTECFLSMLTEEMETLDIVDFLVNDIIGDEKYLVFVGALFGLSIFACSIAFLFVRNEKKPKAE